MDSWSGAQSHRKVKYTSLPYLLLPPPINSHLLTTDTCPSPLFFPLSPEIRSFNPSIPHYGLLYETPFTLSNSLLYTNLNL